MKAILRMTARGKTGMVEMAPGRVTMTMAGRVTLGATSGYVQKHCYILRAFGYGGVYMYI